MKAYRGSLLVFLWETPLFCLIAVVLPGLLLLCSSWSWPPFAASIFWLPFGGSALLYAYPDFLFRKPKPFAGRPYGRCSPMSIWHTVSGTAAFACRDSGTPCVAAGGAANLQCRALDRLCGIHAVALDRSGDPCGNAMGRLSPGGDRPCRAGVLRVHCSGGVPAGKNVSPRKSGGAVFRTLEPAAFPPVDVGAAAVAFPAARCGAACGGGSAFRTARRGTVSAGESLPVGGGSPRLSGYCGYGGGTCGGSRRRPDLMPCRNSRKSRGRSRNSPAAGRIVRRDGVRLYGIAATASTTAAGTGPGTGRIRRTCRFR